MPELASVSESAQHLLVSLVALVALAVVLRKVLGVFGGGPPSSTPATGGAPAGGVAPACGHCASGHAASRATPERRAGP